MKKLLFIAAVFASLSAFAQDEEPIQYIPKHEFTINAFGGLNLGSVMLPGQQNSTYGDTQYLGEETNGAFHTKPGLSFGAGLGYIYHFSDKWAFQTGVDFALYKYHVFTQMDGPTDGYLFNGMYYNYYIRQSYNFVKIFDYVGFSEDATVGSVQIPLMLQWSAPISQKHRFYAAFGPTLALNVYSKSVQKAEEFNAGPWVQYFDGNDKDINTLHNYPDPYRADTTMVVKPDVALFDVRASVEVGVRWSLAPGWGLYTGIYADYGLLNTFLKKNYSMVEGRADWATDGSMYDAYEDTDKWQHHSIFNSVGMPIMYWDYGPINSPGIRPRAQAIVQHAQPGNRYFDGAIHAAAVGFKIRLSFGKVKKHPKPAPIVQTVSEPVVSRPAAPAPVAEVPEEIKRTMQELSVTLFAFDKFNLDAKAIAGLKKVIDWLQEFPDLQVQIEGHTDWEGSDEYNQKLSERRAKSVHDYFVEHGVNPDRLSYIGYGESRPIATNETAEGRQKNRRVELTILQ